MVVAGHPSFTYLHCPGNWQSFQVELLLSHRRRRRPIRRRRRDAVAASLSLAERKIEQTLVASSNPGAGQLLFASADSNQVCFISLDMAIVQGNMSGRLQLTVL